MSKKAVILAGGEGSQAGHRPAPSLPKPLMPLGTEPVLNVVLRQLKAYGFTDLALAVGRLGYLARAMFEDGSKHGVRLAYHHETKPLGTAGALAAVRGTQEPFLVVGGSVLSGLDLADLYETHTESGNVFTIAAHRRPARTEYGVLRREGLAGPQRVIGHEEDPEVAPVVSMGVYVADPRVFDFIPEGRHFGVPDLVTDLVAAGQPVASYPFDGYWLDVGHEEGVEEALVV